MRKVEVVAAAIIENNKVFACQRGYGEQKGCWEFPGGKIEQGESHKDALKREIKEELNTEIEVHSHLRTVFYKYPNFHLTMHCYLCSLESEELTLLEHLSSKWLNKNELYSVNWLPADVDVLEKVEKLLGKGL